MLKKPKKGETCPALINEDYSLMLSGDCSSYCKCAVTNKRCLGVVVDNSEKHQTSRFFDRGVNRIDTEKIKKCPMFGLSKEALAVVVKIEPCRKPTRE